MANVEVPKLCDSTKCTACGACANGCAVNAIVLKEDEFGELHPVIDQAQCVGCGRCAKICPENAMSLVRHDDPIIYAAWLKDCESLKESTSGGAAFAISKAVIDEGGIVWGAAYDADLNVRYVKARSIEELAFIRKSKYVQSSVGLAWREIREELENGKLVLFAGTGCHVKGLLAYLGKDYENLFTLDLVCHGVPGGGVFQKYKKWIEEKFGDKMVDYQPRPKRKDGNETTFSARAVFANKAEIHLERSLNSYFTGFQHNLFLRAACHDCQANGRNRYSDFTVADFWGLGKVKPFKNHRQRTKGISMLALNSEKAKAFLPKIESSLVMEERSYEEASISNKQYYRSSVASPFRTAFRVDLAKLSWEELAKKYMRWSRKEKLLYCIKKFTPTPVLLYAKLLAKWVK